MRSIFNHQNLASGRSSKFPVKGTINSSRYDAQKNLRSYIVGI